MCVRIRTVVTVVSTMSCTKYRFIGIYAQLKTESNDLMGKIYSEEFHERILSAYYNRSESVDR